MALFALVLTVFGTGWLIVRRRRKARKVASEMMPVMSDAGHMAHEGADVASEAKPVARAS